MSVSKRIRGSTVVGILVVEIGQAGLTVADSSARIVLNFQSGYCLAVIFENSKKRKIQKGKERKKERKKCKEEEKKRGEGKKKKGKERKRKKKRGKERKRKEKGRKEGRKEGRKKKKER